jgi:hypothetical protein
MLSERIREMETDLERIPGVGAARIRAEDGEISEIHIVADPARRPKWIVRDAITTLYARHGIRVPHQRISVAGTADPGAVSPIPVATHEEQAPWSMRIVGVHLARQEDRLIATVELRDGIRTARAIAEGLATRKNQIRLVAEAALEGVRKLTGEMIAVDLQEVRAIRLGRLRIVLAHVVLLQAGAERPLIGSCPVRGGRMDAPAGAVLDAVNRLLQSLRARDDEIEYVVEEDGEK